MAVKAVPWYQTKIDVVEQIKKVVAAYPTLTWTAFITGPFYDWVSIHPSIFLKSATVVKVPYTHPWLVPETRLLRLRPSQQESHLVRQRPRQIRYDHPLNRRCSCRQRPLPAREVCKRVRLRSFLHDLASRNACRAQESKRDKRLEH